MLSSGMNCYHLELMLSSVANVIICSYCNVIIWEEMLSSGANVLMWEEMLSSGAFVVIIWSKCYHLVLSCDVIIWDDNTPFFIFPGNFTHSNCKVARNEKISLHFKILKYRREV